MRKKVLVADDEKIVRELLCEKLKEHNCIVFEAEDGEETIDLAIKEKPDVIILDVKMPYMDGIQVCNELKNNKDTKDIKIIMFSAKAELVDRSEGINAGADVYLTKPARFKEIIETIKNVSIA